MKVVFILLILVLSGTDAFSEKLSSHLVSMSGFEESIKKAKEEIVKLKLKESQASSILDKQIIRSDIKSLEKSILIYKAAAKDIEKQVMLEHNSKDRKTFQDRNIKKNTGGHH